MLPTRLALGTLRLGDDAAETIHAALDGGIRVFDTARAYGEAEARLGAALAAHAAGAQAFVITKGGMARPGGNWRADGRASTLRADCEASLRALGRPIDLYLVHAPDPRVRWSTTVRALARLADEKLVRAIGVSNVSLAQLDEALTLAPIAAVQVAFSLADDGALRAGLVARCRARNLALLAHSPLGGPRRAKKLLSHPLLTAIAQHHGVAPAAVALAALIDAHEVVTPIAGARTPDAARQICAAPSVRLDDSERQALAVEFSALRASPIAAAARVASVDGEVVLIMGLPGAGKSVLAGELAAAGYERLNRDERGGSLSALARLCDERLTAGARRVVLDNTYLARASRAEVLAIAARHGLAVRGVYIDVPPADAQVNVVWRMLDAHGRLLAPDELRRGRDNTALAPTSLYRLQRTLEPPADDEGFSALERRPFVRVPRTGRAARFVSVDLADTPGKIDADELRDAFVIGWAPDAPADLESRLSARAAGVLLCRHGGGPPVCWCRPPLPGLVLALAHAHGLDVAQCELIGSSAAHRSLAAAVGARFVQR